MTATLPLAHRARRHWGGLSVGACAVMTIWGLPRFARGQAAGDGAPGVAAVDAGGGGPGAASAPVPAMDPAVAPLPRTDEPPVEAICRAAVALALVEPERAQSFVKRARLAGWLPELHLRAYRRFARTEGLTYADMSGAAGSPVDVSAVDDVRYEWRASWDLSRMVFNPDELQAHFEALRMADVRRDIQSLVIKLYFERRRLLSEAETARASGASREKRAWRIAELEAELDAVSGGAFTGAAKVHGQKAGSP